jgi:hypothetical protein
MAPWRFLEAMDATESFLRQDVAALSTATAVKAQLDVELLKFAQLPQLRWPYAKVLEGKCKGLIELRFEYRNVEYRPLGYYGPGWAFVIIMMAREKNPDWVPKDACKTARARKRLIDANPTRVRDYGFGLHGILAPERNR